MPIEYIADTYDVVVVGAGHAGCEAALAAARMGHKTLIVTVDMSNFAFMPCILPLEDQLRGIWCGKLMRWAVKWAAILIKLKFRCVC